MKSAASGASLTVLCPDIGWRARAGTSVLVIACLILFPLAAFAQLPTPTHGWNLGNTLEPPGGEGTWGPAATQNLINSVADSGFNTVRLPVAWDSHANQTTYEIDPAWMARVKQVVDWCYARNLYVVVNCHWDNGWLENNITGSVNATINAKMNSYWTQIANTFKNYDSKLLFAGANEPGVNTAAQMSTLLVYYQTYVDAVRATGGNNTSRWLVVQGPTTDIDLTDQLMNTLPNDPTPGRLAVEVHYYSPYQWTLMKTDAAWGKMFYFWGQAYHSATTPTRNATWGEEAYLEAEFQKMKTKFIDHGIPVILGEFQAMKRTGNPELTEADLTLHAASRTYFHKCVVDSANSKGLKPIYWDLAGQQFDWTTGALLDPDNTRALTGGAALLPTGLPADVAPTIATQPASQTVTAGSSASFSVSTTGTAPLSYQWSKGATAITGATSASYSLSSTAASDAGSYSVTISNAGGSVTSNAAVLTVNVAPAITTQPVSQTIVATNPVTFTVAASGTPTPTFQWQKNGVDITGATLTSYTVSAVAEGDAGNYQATATNSVGATTSNITVLTVNVAPAITTQPVSQAITTGDTVTFTAAATGSPSPTYQWRKDGVDLSGATASSYTLASTVAGDAGSYAVVATNPAGSATSAPAILAVGTPPAGFDVTAYLSRYPTVAANFASNPFGAWLYYRDHGIYNGEVYDQLFRVGEYLTLYPELFTLFGDDLGGALVHWLTIGRIEGRLGRIPLEFSATGYFSRNPDVATAVNNDPLLAWSHYWLYGIYEGRAYDDDLRVFEYLAINADLTAAFVNDWRQAALHWMRYGRTEGRLGRLALIFSVTEYLNRNPDVAATWGTNPTTVFLHFWLYGINEGRTFDDLFRVDDYLALNPDLAAIFGPDRRGAFKHWVRYGMAEGRPGRNS